MTLLRSPLPQPATRLSRILHLLPPHGKKVAERVETHPAGLPEVTDVMREMYTLLQDYSPSWYSEHHHNRIQQALRQLERLQCSHQDSPQLPAAN